MSRSTAEKLQFAAAAGTLLVLLSACGSPAPATESTADAALPESVRKAGVLNIATYAGYPPLTFHKDGEIVGMEIDLARAVGAELGVKTNFVDTPFEAIIPGLLSKRYDMSISDMSDTAARQEKVDFVDYATAFSSILVAKGNPLNIQTLGDLCGHPIATQTASLQSKTLEAESKKCTDSGKQPIKISLFPNSTQVALELTTGRTVAQVRDWVLGDQFAKDPGNKVEIAMVNGAPAKIGEPAPVGMAFAKNSTQLRDAVKAALQRLMDNGEYKKILQKYNLETVSIDAAKINGSSK